MFCREVAILSKLNSSYVINFVGATLDDPSVSEKNTFVIKASIFIFVLNVIWLCNKLFPNSLIL
jgi:hypothetical protein